MKNTTGLPADAGKELRKMNRRGVWTAIFLALTAAAVAMEIVAGAVWPSSDRPAWTDLIVGNVPAEITTAAVGLLTTWLGPHFAAAYSAPRYPRPVPSTQSRHPWRATLRTVVAGLVAFAPVAGELVAGAHLDGTAVGAQIIAYAALVTRVLAIPGVERWLQVYLPWLAPSPPRP